MVYKVIGLMSGSSLDGLDIVYTLLEETRGNWKFDIIEAEVVSYSSDLTKELAGAQQLSVPDFLRLHTRYGRYLGEQVNGFIQKHGFDHKVDFIASHGHTVFHDPVRHTSVQLGDGATIAAITGLPVISDLRSVDVALGGQGAPIVPIGDKLLFGDFDYWLNLGGIANLTARAGEELHAFDVCPANQILNILAERAGKAFDENGQLARSGSVLPDVLEQLAAQDYYAQPAPKSLSNEAARALALPFVSDTAYDTRDLLRTVTEHIASQIAAHAARYPHEKEGAKMLATGGGALNNFLIERLQELLEPQCINLVVPYEQVTQFKEALVMALIGALRWREEANTLSCVTGSSRDSIGGALWIV